MENLGDFPTNSIGFCLLPSELIQNILLHLALPDIIRLKSLNKSVADVISDRNFAREYNSRSSSTTWLFVYKKRWHRDAILHGFTDQSNRWFNFQIANLLKPMICPGENIYFLTASGNVFLFVCNTRREVIAVNLVTKMVKKIPPSQLGPRGTSSWRRSGMKLVTEGSDHFRFLFVELVDHYPVLFAYYSETDTWQSMEARDDPDGLSRADHGAGDRIFLNVINAPFESVMIAVGSKCNAPVIVRPRYDGRRNDGQLSTVGFNQDYFILDRLHMFGDGHMLVIKSIGVDNGDSGVRMLNGIELWGLGLNGSHWEYISEVPHKIMEEIKKPYRVMRGCLERGDGIIRAVLLSNYDGLWDIVWLSYDRGRRNHWTWVPLPDCKMKGLNMAGIAFSSGLTLS